MFHQLFRRPCAVRRHCAGLLLEERLRYLAYLADLGMRRNDLQIRAHFVLVIAQFLRLDGRPDEAISRDEIVQGGCSGPRSPNRAKSLDLGARARCSPDSRSLGFGSWGDSSRHPIHLVRSPENLLHLRSTSAARGVWRPLPSRVVARRSIDSSVR
jgi:hypothetical protein